MKFKFVKKGFACPFTAHLAPSASPLPPFEKRTEKIFVEETLIKKYIKKEHTLKKKHQGKMGH